LWHRVYYHQFTTINLREDRMALMQSVDATRTKLRDVITEIKKLSPKRIFAELNDIIESLAKTESSFDSNTTKKLDLLKKSI
jgi:hypothetical protein